MVPCAVFRYSNRVTKGHLTSFDTTDKECVRRISDISLKKLLFHSHIVPFSRVPNTYLEAAFLGLSAYLAFRKFNNLRRINTAR